MIPANEQGTVALFAKLADEMGYKFKEIGTHCPDAILQKDGRLIRVEFEYHSKTFLAHKHNPEDVDLIICWEDDWPNAPLPVLSLEYYMSLTRPEPPRVFMQRLVDGWVELRRAWSGRRRICPMCGTELSIQCWTYHDEEHYVERMVDRDCPKCKYHETESYYP